MIVCICKICHTSLQRTTYDIKMADINDDTHQQHTMTNTIDLTGDSDEEYYWPSYRKIRRRKLTEFYTPENETSKKKKKQKCSNSSKYVGFRLAKYFGGELYLGTVTFIDSYCHIEYDDGDEEDVGSDELQVLMQLYRKEGRRLESSTVSAKKQGCQLEAIQSQCRKTKLQVPSAETVKNQTAEPNSSSTSQTHIPNPFHKSKKSSKRTTLFDIHNISPQQIESVRNLIPRQHHDSAKLVSEFFLLCYERQLIWQRKRAGLREHSQDAKMAKHFYCNVYRELDRGTQYFRANLIHHRSHANGKFDLEEVLWDSLCYRLVNKIETFEKFGGIPRRDEFKQFVSDTFLPMWESDMVVFTSAHQNMGKDRYLATMKSLYREDGNLIKKLASKISSAKDLQTCYNVLLQVDNVGKFFAWQVLCDLLEAKVIPFTENEWVKLGPGAIGGLKAIFGKSIVKTVELVQLTMLLHEIKDQVYRALELTFPKFIGREITVKNIEHALCEFCKYTDEHVMRRYDIGGKGSRSHLDLAKSCQVCDKSYDWNLSKLCDLCRTAYCGSCCGKNGRDFEGAWLCSTCIQMQDDE